MHQNDFNKPFDELQEAEIKANFRRMYNDLGLKESMVVYSEIIETAMLLLEVITEELENAIKKKGKK